MQGRRLSVLAAAIFVGLLACTAEGPLGVGRPTTVSMQFLTPATVKSLVVEVTGPGIDPAVVMNIPVGADTVATGSLTLPSGSARRFVVTAVDTAGVQTHRADTTITLQPGTNATLAMRLEPLPSTLGITVTFGGVRLVVSDTSTRVLNVGDTMTIAAYAIRANGDTVPAESLVWGTSNPAATSVANGVVQAARLGAAQVAVSYQGASAQVGVRVVAPDDPASRAIVDVQSGGPYSCARRGDGTVECWGSLPTGQYLAEPTEITPGIRWRSFSAGFSVLCGVASDRRAYCWGINPFGQLGAGIAPNDQVYAEPQQLAGGLQWDEIAAGHYAACGTTYPERALHCWGGVGTNLAPEGPIGARSTSPVPVGGVGLRYLTVGSALVCGTGTSDGLPYCVGDVGALSLSTLTQMTAPESVVRTMAVGQSTGCSVTVSGAAYCFGVNNFGQLTGAPTADPFVLPDAPQQIGSGVTWREFFSGRTLHFCGVATSGQGFCWGSNVSGQLGDGTTANRLSPVALPHSWLVLAPGLGITGPGSADHTCGLTAERRIFCWGSGAAGQLGTGDRSSSLLPVQVPIAAR